jgi:hypothetical protein
MTLTLKVQTYAACVAALEQWQFTTAPHGILGKKIEGALRDLKDAARTAVDLDMTQSEPPVIV